MTTSTERPQVLGRCVVGQAEKGVAVERGARVIRILAAPGGAVGDFRDDIVVERAMRE